LLHPHNPDYGKSRIGQEKRTPWAGVIGSRKVADGRAATRGMRRE
jgi:hypothetical protein